MNEWLAQLWKNLGLSTKVQLRVMRILQDEFLVGVTGIIFNEQDEILVVKHTYRGNWSLPGGYIKKGEHPKEALEREIKEETQLVVSADERMKIRTDRDSARLDITYSGSFIGGEFRPSKEVSEAGFFAFNKLPLLRRDQLVFIERALRTRTAKHQSKTT